jgi:alkylation response protein AidB-like acyl-CoA dehydrogenase
MYVPHACGGLQLPLPEILQIEECLAWADGSTAWVVTLCSGAAWFVGFLDEALSKEVFANPHVCFAGSGAATGTAQVTDTGYEINGNWKYASGALHATVFTANCVVWQHGKPLYHDNGTPVIRAFVLMKDEITLQKTWNSLGMVATASHSFEARHLQVPATRGFTIDARTTVLKHPLYQYPFLQLAETTLAVNLSGMAVRFLDLCAPLFDARIARVSSSSPMIPDLQTMLNDARLRLDQCRNTFYAAVQVSWQQCNSGKSISSSVLDDVSVASHALAYRARTLVDLLYPYCGLAAADVSTEINRVWRNLHTASQHALFSSR